MGKDHPFTWADAYHKIKQAERSEATVKALKAEGKDVPFVKYRGEGHTFEPHLPIAAVVVGDDSPGASGSARLSAQFHSSISTWTRRRHGWGLRMMYRSARPSSGQPSTTFAVWRLKPTPDENLAITAASPVRR
jgi:hypothetical protein